MDSNLRCTALEARVVRPENWLQIMRSTDSELGSGPVRATLGGNIGYCRWMVDGGKADLDIGKTGDCLGAKNQGNRNKVYFNKLKSVCVCTRARVCVCVSAKIYTTAAVHRLPISAVF